MLLGADFIMAHHIYVARKQGKIYFTYGGGHPFLTDRAGLASSGPTVAAAPPPGFRQVEADAGPGGEPDTADAFARRGNARLAQGKFKDSIADLSAAIQLAPGTGSYHRDRAKAYMQSGARALARTDIDQALALDPQNDEMLRARAGMRLADHDAAGALADTDAAARVTPPSSLRAAAVALLYTRLHHPALAIPLLDAVISAHDADVELGVLLNARCWSRALANVELDKALGDCNRAIKRDGPKGGYLDSRGLVYLRKGQLKAAIADYDAALLRDPAKAWSLYGRGTAKLALGQVDSGQADLKAALVAQAGIDEDARAYGISAPMTPAAPLPAAAE